MPFASHYSLVIALAEAADNALAALFAEELGAVIQVRNDAVDALLRDARNANVAAHVVGTPTKGDRLAIRCGDVTVLDEARRDLHRAWSATTHAMQRLRDNPQAADQEYARLLDDEPGLLPTLTFDPYDDVAAPFVASGARPRVAVLREQGVNGQVEMAAALTRAGFDAFDVHMSDL